MLSRPTSDNCRDVDASGLMRNGLLRMVHFTPSPPPSLTPHLARDVPLSRPLALMNYSPLVATSFRRKILSWPRTKRNWRACQLSNDHRLSPVHQIARAAENNIPSQGWDARESVPTVGDGDTSRARHRVGRRCQFTRPRLCL